MEQTLRWCREGDASSTLGARRLRWCRRRGRDDDARGALRFASSRAAEDFVRSVLADEPARRVLLGFVAQQRWPHAERWGPEALIAHVARALTRGELRVEAPRLRVGPPGGEGGAAEPALLPEDTRERKALYADVRGGWETRSLAAVAEVDWDTKDLTLRAEVDWDTKDLSTGVEATWMTKDLAAEVSVPPPPHAVDEADDEGELA